MESMDAADALFPAGIIVNLTNGREITTANVDARQEIQW
jgi:hypothetical protein